MFDFNSLSNRFLHLRFSGVEFLCSHERILRVLREDQSSEVVLLFASVTVKLQSNGRILQHLRLVSEIENLTSIRHEANSIALNKDLHKVPVALLFDLRPGAAINRSISAIRIPDAPVVTEHQQGAFEPKRVVSLVGKLLTQSTHG